MKSAQSLLLSIVSSVDIPNGDVVAVNIQASADLLSLAKDFSKFTAVQSMFTLNNQLKSLNLPTTPFIPDHFNHCVFVGTKHRSYNLHVFYKTLTTLKPGGVFISVFENEIGASRYEKDFCKLYDGPLFSVQKSKCRVFGTTNFNLQHLHIDAIDDIQITGSNSFLFNQGELDNGSKILANVIGSQISGSVYEPCSGAGALSATILANNPSITKLIGVEADWMSLEHAKKTCIDSRANFIWGDATKPSSEKFKTIVLNPPFHSGIKVDQSLGLKCIQAAFESLDLQGVLYVVQNEFLPYRKSLPFGERTKVITRENGFIVWQYNA